MKASELSGTVKTKYNYIGKKRKKPTFDFDLELISKYFKGIKYRGLYYIEVKQQVVFELRKAKFTFNEIGDIFGMDHTSIVYINNNRVPHPLALEMKYKWRELITNMQYPVTVYDNKLDKKTFTKVYQTFTEFVDREDFLNYICSNQ